MKTTIGALATLVGVPFIIGCVSEGRYDQAVKDANQARAELSRTALDRDQKRDEAARLGDVVTKLRAECNLRAEQLAASQGQSNELSMSLEQAKARLEEVRRAHLAAEARAVLFRELTMKLKRMVDDGQLSIVLRDGRMVLQLPNDVLFDTGRTEVKPNGQAALKAIAGAIKTMQKRQFQVAGHTDNVPISTERFPSNWELSSGRALTVVRFLIAQGVPAPMLSAAGYGEMDPVSSNDTVEGKRKNRRTEITLLPNIDEFVVVPQN
jgi:chemotaxis protein MotB